MATLSDADQKRKLKRKQDDVTKEMKEYFYIENKEDGRPSGYTDNCPFWFFFVTNEKTFEQNTNNYLTIWQFDNREY